MAGVLGQGRVHCVTAAVDMANNAFAINHESSPFGDAQESEHSVLACDSLFSITQEREGKTQLLSKAAVGSRLIHADTQHLGARAFEFGKTILVCL